MLETKTPAGFRALGLSSTLLDKLNRFGFTIPTPIQSGAIPLALAGRDVIGIAQTGTGKTLAFGLPMVARMKPGEVGLILAPTRELAQQIEETFYQLGCKTALIIGGASMGRQVSMLRGRPQIIVATPGRLMDHMGQGTVDLRRVAIVVLDEGDRMLDMGFAPAIRRILDRTPSNRQTMLFSATMPREIAELAKQYLRNSARVDIETEGVTPDRVQQELLMLSQADKPEMLGEILHEHKGTVLVFARTRHGAKKLARTVRNFGHSAAELHSDRSLAQRRDALQGFKNGSYRVLVATDIAARGIDVKEIALVVNFDVPQNPEDYIHRIGRTGRAGAAGRAITMATPDQHSEIRDIEKLLQLELKLSPRSRAGAERPSPAASRPKQKRWRPRGYPRPSSN
jgi:ATP-dependent RNA helicase RhlE